jgi:hypothetical protein
VRGPRSAYLAILAAWVVALLITQAWPGIDEGVRVEFATDAGVYREMATAAPGLPEGPVRDQHAQRWVVHWGVGSAAHAAGLDLETTYRIASLAVAAAVALLLHVLLAGIGLSAAAHAVCLGIALAGAYPFRYWLAAPGMVSDAVFGLGLAIVLLGLQRRRTSWIVTGLVVGTVARQTALPAALALAAVLLVPATSFLASRRDRLAAAAAVALAPLAVFVAVRWVARGFSVADLPPLEDLTILADSPRELGEHLGRLVLGIAFPFAALATCFGLFARDLVAPLALSAAIVAQPLVLSFSWIDANEPRLAALAVPALAVAAAQSIERITIAPGVGAAVCVALLLGSFHHRYSAVDIGRSGWVALAGLATLVTFAGLGFSRLRSGNA